MDIYLFCGEDIYYENIIRSNYVFQKTFYPAGVYSDEYTKINHS